MRAQQKFNNKYEQRQSIVGTITALMGELQKCAPHPDNASYNGPLFIAQNANFKTANDHDSMLGSMVMESLIGTAFASAASEIVSGWSEDIANLFDEDGLFGGFDAAAAMECYSEYIKDVEQSTLEKATNGQGSFARMSGKSISGAFNTRSKIDAPLQAFYEDMPKRLMIEKELAFRAQQLMEIDNAPAYEQEAPMPRFAA